MRAEKQQQIACLAIFKLHFWNFLTIFPKYNTCTETTSICQNCVVLHICLCIILKTIHSSKTIRSRARMIILAFAGQANETIAQIVQCERHMVGVWRRRWVRAFQCLVLVECGEKSSALPQAIERLLSDSPRRGWAGKVFRRTGDADYRCLRHPGKNVGDP